MIQYEILEKLLEFFRQRVSPLLHDAPQEGFFSGRKYTPVYEKRAKRKENNLLKTTYLESKLSRVVVHSAAEHERENVSNTFAVENFVTGRRTEASVGQGGPHHRQRVCVHLHRAGLEKIIPL